MRFHHLEYNRNLKPIARDLRKHGTIGEAVLWKKALRARNMEGYQFNRQLPIGDYIVDFISRKLNLIIEIDGFNGDNNMAVSDLKKREMLQNQGYFILTFSEDDILHQLDNVILKIVSTIKQLEGHK